jgi:hypothetical protein
MSYAGTAIARDLTEEVDHQIATATLVAAAQLVTHQ